MKDTWENIINLKPFASIDRQRALFFYKHYGLKQRISGNENCRDFEVAPLVYVVIMLLSKFLQEGHSCLYLSRVAGRELSSFFDGIDGEELPEIALPQLEELRDMVSPICGDDESLQSSPLIMTGDRLYFSQQRFYEKEIVKSIEKICNNNSPSREHSLKHIEERFYSFFTEAEDSAEPDYQAVAAYMALKSPFCVVSGGPGTGKTSTVVKIIALLIEDMLFREEEPRVALVAPTGKAAARLMESIEVSLSSMELPHAVKNFIPQAAHTIHRLLGVRGGAFLHHRENRLDKNIIVVDESSMVDLSLMYRLLSAMPEGGRIILLGDRDQLASVEGGAVFGDICNRGGEPIFSRDFIQGLSEFFPSLDSSDLGEWKQVSNDNDNSVMKNHLAVLSKSYRFSEESLIKSLSRSIREGRAEEVLSLLHEKNDEVKYIKHGDLGNYLQGRLLDSLGPHGKDGGAEFYVRELLSSLMVISAHRKGQWGVDGLNLLFEEILVNQGVVKRDSPFYCGRPVMVTGNNYSLSLFNGDRGVVGERGGGRSVIFSEGKEVPIACMPGHITSYAMTIHKSQGSESREVMVVLPENYSTLLSRELLYTAVTRTKSKLVVVGTDEIISQMVKTRTLRQTGLQEELWG